MFFFCSINTNVNTLTRFRIRCTSKYCSVLLHLTLKLHNLLFVLDETSLEGSVNDLLSRIRSVPMIYNYCCSFLPLLSKLQYFEF